MLYSYKTFIMVKLTLFLIKAQNKENKTKFNAAPEMLASSKCFSGYVPGSNSLWPSFPKFPLCNCKDDKLYSIVGGKPHLGCFTRMLTVSAISIISISMLCPFTCLLFDSGRIVIGM